MFIFFGACELELPIRFNKQRRRSGYRCGSELVDIASYRRARSVPNYQGGSCFHRCLTLTRVESVVKHVKTGVNVVSTGESL